MIIDERRGSRGSFDYCRIGIEPNPPCHPSWRVTPSHHDYNSSQQGGGRHSGVTATALLCDGLIGVLSCANRWCDGCGGLIGNPSHPSQTGLERLLW